MLKQSSGPINFTVFLSMFGEKLKGLSLLRLALFVPPRTRKGGSSGASPEENSLKNPLFWGGPQKRVLHAQQKWFFKGFSDLTTEEPFSRSVGPECCLVCVDGW